MNTATGFKMLACQTTVAGLLILAGCRGEHSPGEHDDHDDHDHIGHVIPAHKPKTYPDAVHRLRELNDAIAGGAGGGGPSAALDAKTLEIALDIANWLPEIAAESEMPPAPWNEVNARSAALVADYQSLLPRAGAMAADPAAAARDAGRVITELETALAAADPKWFAEPGKSSPAP